MSLYDDEFGTWLPRFSEQRGARAVIVVDVERVSDSCGYGVPLMDHVGERDLLPPFMDRKGAAGQAEYRRRWNRASIDGIPGFDDDPDPDTDPDYDAGLDPDRAPATT